MTSATPAIPTSEFLIPLNEITISPDRARDIDSAWAEALASIIAVQGLTNAITVRLNLSGGYGLVTGLHRFGAHQILKSETIRARLSNATTDDEARLEEVMENLARHELKALDRCRHLFELKQVYERMHPEAKAGVAGGLARQGSANEIFSFAADTAEKVGLSERSIQIAVKIWKGLAPATSLRIAGTWLADNQSGLKLISEKTPASQAKALDILFADKPKASTVPEALALIETGAVLTPAERKAAAVTKALASLPAGARQGVMETAAPEDARLAEMKKSISTLSSFLGKLKDDELDRVVVEHEDRIIASLQRRGRI